MNVSSQNFTSLCSGGFLQLSVFELSLVHWSIFCLQLKFHEFHKKVHVCLFVCWFFFILCAIRMLVTVGAKKISNVKTFFRSAIK